MFSAKTNHAILQVREQSLTWTNNCQFATPRVFIAIDGGHRANFALLQPPCTLTTYVPTVFCLTCEGESFAILFRNSCLPTRSTRSNICWIAGERETNQTVVSRVQGSRWQIAVSYSASIDFQGPQKCGEKALSLQASARGDQKRVQS